MKTVIGLEIHVQLKTKSKMFCGCDNQPYAKVTGGKLADEAAPNTLICPICMGYPGVLPVANQQAIEWTVKTGLALNAQIAEFSKFDRKHYFYPDLPKNYQISQYDLPFCLNGRMEIRSTKSEIRNIRIQRIHLEEDAGKLIHISSRHPDPALAGEGSPSGQSLRAAPANAGFSDELRDSSPAAQNDNQGYSLVDLNRAGTPLMEVVTEPEISSPQEAKIFMQELRSFLRYLDVSDADMEKGHLRCDANISIAEIRNSPAARGMQFEIRNGELGTPVEIKNMNSFRMVERALAYEEKRQKELLEKGQKIEKETRGWDDIKGVTYSQRGKEQAQDYRYFPEPDLPPFYLHKLFNIEKLKSELPELPAAKRQRYIDSMKLPITDAEILTVDKQMASYFEKIAEKVPPKLAANWVINELKMDGLLIIKPENLADLLVRLEKGEITGKIAKEVLKEMIETGKTAHEIIQEKGLAKVGDEAELDQIIEKVIADNPQGVADYKKGKTQALQFLFGQVMGATRGQAKPEIINKILSYKLRKVS